MHQFIAICFNMPSLSTFPFNIPVLARATPQSLDTGLTFAFIGGIFAFEIAKFVRVLNLIRATMT